MKLTSRHRALNHLGRALLALALSFTLTPLPSASAAPAGAQSVLHSAGDLDLTFGSDGQVMTQVIAGEEHFGPKMVVQPDDKIVVAGECGDDELFCLIRHNADGSLDTGFGAPNGYVTTNIGSGTDRVRDLALQSDGKIVVVGDCYDPTQKLCVARYNSDGSLDSANFGAPNGFVVFDYVLDDEAESVAIQPDGKIIVAGECNDDNYLCVARLNSDGSLDTATFNSPDGFNVINPSSGDDDEDPEVALQADGKIVIAASCDDRDDVCVARFNSDGTEDDATFGGVGNNWTRTPIGTQGFNYIGEVRITSSGRILVSGECDNIRDVCVLAYDSSGALDSSFGGGDGIVRTQVKDDWNSGQGMVLQSDGKILVVGTCLEYATVCLLRYEENGDLDNGFGEDGHVLHNFTPDYEFGKDVVIQSDGKIVISADCQVGSQEQFCLARFYGEDVLGEEVLYTGISGGSYYFDDAWVYIPPGAVPSSPDADIDMCILTIEEVGIAATLGVQLDEFVWEVTIECDGRRISSFYPALTICLPPMDGSTSGKQLYTRHDGETAWNPLPLVYARDDFVCGTSTRLSLFLVGRPDYPLTGYAPGLITELPAQPAAAAYAATDMVLSIGKLGLDLSIVGVPQSPNGWDVTWLGDQAGYLDGSAFPTWAGNTVLTAHVWGADNTPGPFHGLKELAYGDRIVIAAFGQRYIYEVRSVALLDANGIPQFEHSEYDMLTLITCESFDESSGDYLYRRVVSAVLTRVD